MKRLLLALVVMGATAMPALAHRLVVFASYDAETRQIVVETKFSNGNPAQRGEVRLMDATAVLLGSYPLAEGGITRIDLPAEGTEAGVSVEVFTDEGHDDYWVLTPADLGVQQ